MFTPEQRKEVEAAIRQERTDARAERKHQVAIAQALKNKMSVQEKIDFVNTPYDQLPEELRAGMTRRPQTFNFVRISKPNIGRQQETFAARLIRYRDKYSLKPEQFCAICNELAVKYDIPAEKGRRSQRTRITLRDINNYENFNICPKIDKMTVIAEAMGVDIDYFAGYGAQSRRSRNQLVEARYRKSRKKAS